MPTKYVHINGHSIYLHYAGKTTLPDVMPDLSKGRKIVFVHGSGTNGNIWHNQIDHLAAAHSPFAIDLPGHGRSSGVEGLGSIGEYADFLAASFDTLEIDSAIVVGHSLGTLIAVEFARRHASRAESIVLIATAARFNLEARIESARAVAMGRMPQQFGTETYSPKTVMDNFDVIREGWMEQVKTDPRVRYTDLIACHQVDFRTMEKLRKPALILAGADDHVSTPADGAAMASRIEGAKFQVIPDGGHALPWERPAEVNAALDSFFADLSAPPGQMYLR